MFKKLFGSTNAPTAKQAAPIADPMVTMQRLQEQIESVKARSKKVEVEMQNRLKEALEKKKQKDNRGAIFALKRKKMLEGELGKLDGQMIMLEQQRLMIETSMVDTQVFQALNEGSRTIEAQSKMTNIDDMEELKERLEEQKADMDEKNEFFIRAGQMEDEDELLDELNELEAQMEEEELSKLEIGSGPLNIPSGGQQLPSAQVSSKAQPSLAKSEEDELRQLEAMMAL
eukprot:403339917